MDLNSLSVICLVIFLVVAVAYDLATHRIPNWLNITIVCFGAFFQVYLAGIEGLFSALLGLVAGLCCFLPFYIAGAMGAGDVKLLAAVGCFFGPLPTLQAAIYTLIAGGVMALITVLLSGGLAALARRYYAMVCIYIGTGKFFYQPPQSTDIAGMKLAYALPIALGSVWVLINRDLIDATALQKALTAVLGGF